MINRYLICCLPILSCVLSASAADLTWRGLSLGWWDADAWTSGGVAQTWVNGNTAVLEANPADLSVPLSKEARMTQATIRDSYTFSGATLTVHGNFYVADGKTVTAACKLNQDNASDVKYRFVKGAAGTLAVRSGATFKRFQQNAGTTRLENGCTVEVSGGSEKTKTVDGTDGVAASFTGGNFIVTDGATFKMTNTGAKYLTTSGAAIALNDGGVFDAWNVGEVLHAFKDNSTTAAFATSSFTVDDGGLLIAKKFRIGNASEAQFKGAATCARVNLNAGGVASVAEWSSHTAGYYGELLFNGGTWVMTNATASTATEYPFGNPDSGWATKWKNIRVTVGEGGARIRNLSTMKRKICKPFEGGAAADGGLHVEGAGYVYMAATNTFNGGTWLEGTGYYIPRDDRAFGAVPDEPTDNIFIANSTGILHFDDEAVIHPNRNVLISSNVVMRTGNTRNVTFKGTIHTAGEDPSASALRVLNNWDGALTLAPTDGRTNEVGRIEARGHLVIADGVTRVLKDTGTTASTSSALYIGNLAANNTDAGTAFDANKGVLEVSGGRLEVAENVYVQLDNYGQLKVDGGTVDATNAREILNAMKNTPSQVEVIGTGVLDASLLRVSHMSDVEKALDADGLPLAAVHVATGGVLRLTRFSLDVSDPAATRYGRIDLDGGTVTCRESRNDFLGVGDATKANVWTGIVVRACAGGAIFDTAGTTNHVRRPIVSGVAAGETDGGVTKRGAGRLALMGGANSYTGKTRVDAGTLVFPNRDNFPGGDLEVSAQAVRNQPRDMALIETNELHFRDDAKIRIVETEAAEEDFGRPVILAKVTGSGDIVDNMPTSDRIVVVDKDGREQTADANGKWAVRLSADKKTILLCKRHGFGLFIR